MSKKLQITFIAILVIFVIGLVYSNFSKGAKLTITNSDIEGCVEKVNEFFSRMNTYEDHRLDYSYADNDSALIQLLGSDYNYTSRKNNNCYAIVKNYNPLINEYRYSILNVDIEELNPVLLEHDFNSSSSASYREDFLNSYIEFFVYAI